MPSLAIGLVFDLLGSASRGPESPPDADAEYEPEETVVALEAAIRGLGCEPVRLGNPHALLARAGKGEVPRLDAALSIAEGFATRNREAWAPILLEMLEIPALGSDALTLSLSLDKEWTRAVVSAAGVPVAPGASVRAASELRPGEPAPFPLFVKPRWEGTAKGITPRSRVEDAASLDAAVAHVVSTYRQPALVEAFLPGAEYTVTLIGNGPPRALPVLQRALESRTRIGLHALERHAPPDGAWSFEVPGALDPALEAELARLAILAFDALACRDFARADFRLDAAGRPVFLEINPLPTFAPDGSFGILAELLGRSHASLLGEALGAGLRRLGLAG